MTQAKRRGADRPAPYADAPSPDESDRDDEGDRVPQLPSTYLLNGRFLAVSALIVVGLAGGLFALHGAQQHRNRSVLRERAEKKLADGDDAAAARLLRQFLLLSPDDLDARLQLDTLRWEQAQTQQQIENALLSSEPLLRDHPDLADVRRRQVENLLLIGRHSDALDHLATLRESGADDAALDVWEGLGHEMADEFREAEQSYLRVVNREEDFPPVPYGERELSRFDIVSRLAALYMGELNDESLAFGIVNDAIDRFPKSAELLTLRARLRATDGDSEDALLGDLDEAVALSGAAESLPDIGTILLYAAQLRRSADPQPERVERVIGYCRGLAAAGTDDYRLYQEWAALESARGHADEALDILRQGQAAFPEDPMMGVLLVEELIAQEQPEHARELATSLRKEPLPRVFIDYLRGQIALADQNWPEARGLFERLGRKRDVPPELAVRATRHLGRCLGELGLFHEQLEIARRLLSEDPESVPAQLAVARGLLNVGRIDEAIVAYKSLPTDAIKPVELVRLQLQRVLVEQPVQRNWQSFDKAVAAASQVAGDDPELAILQATSLEHRGRADEAVAVLGRAVEKSPERLNLRIRLIESVIRQGELERAAELIEEAREIHGQNILLTAVEIPLWREQDRPVVIDKLNEIEKQLAGASLAEQIFVVARLIDAYAQQGQSADALRLRKKLAFELAPKREVLLRLLAFALSTHDRATADEVQDRLRKLEGKDGVFAVYAGLVVDVTADPLSPETIDRAGRRLDELIRRRPDVALFSLAKAYLNDRTGHVPEATADYLAAVGRGAREPQVLRRLTDLLVAQGRFDDIEKLASVQSGSSSNSITDEQVFTVAGLLAGDADAVMADMIWSGRVLAATRKFDQAEAAFRRATQVAPDRAEGWFSLTEFLIGQNRKDDAEKVAAAARSHLSSPELNGRLDEILGDLPAAEAHYRRAYENGKSNPQALSLSAFYLRNNRAADAIPVLEKLLARTSDVSPGDTVSARRMLAGALGTSNYAGLQKAVSLLEQNIAEAADASMDQRQLAYLLARYPFPEHAARIIEILTGLQTSQPLTATEIMMLGLAYDMRGMETEAVIQWELLLSRADVTPKMLKAYISRELRHGRPNLVDEALEKLRATGQSDADVLGLDGWRLCLLDRPDEAVRRVDGFLGETAAVSDGDVERDRTVRAAGVLHELAERFIDTPKTAEPLASRAEELYRLALADRPGSAFQLSRLLAVQNRGTDALKVLEQARGQLPDLQRLAAALEVMARADLKEQERDQIKTWVDESLSGELDVPRLTLLAQFALLSGDRQRATELNRRILKESPENAAARNTLSWLLTLQGAADEAIPLIEQVIGRIGPQPALLDTRAMARLEAGDFSGAIEDLRQALDQGESPAIRYHLVLAYLRAGNPNIARLQFDKLPEDHAALRRSLPVSDREEFDQVRQQFGPADAT